MVVQGPIHGAQMPSSSTSEVSRHVHTTEPGHSIDIANAEILEVEPRWFERGVKEAIHIRTLCPSLNKDRGRYNLSPIWTSLLRNRGRGAARKPSNFLLTSEDDVTNNTSHVKSKSTKYPEYSSFLGANCQSKHQHCVKKIAKWCANEPRASL